MNVSFEGVNEQVLSFKSATGDAAAEKGKFAAMSDNFTVAVCAANSVFVGMCINKVDNFADIMTRGYMECKYSGTAPKLGYVKLACASADTVASADAGREVLVLKVDTANKTVGFIM